MSWLTLQWEPFSSIYIYIYIYVCWYVVLSTGNPYKKSMPKFIGGITGPKHAHAQSQVWEVKTDLNTVIIHSYYTSKILETIAYHEILQHLSDHYLLYNKKFRYLPGAQL